MISSMVLQSGHVQDLLQIRFNCPKLIFILCPHRYRVRRTPNVTCRFYAVNLSYVEFIENDVLNKKPAHLKENN